MNLNYEHTTKSLILPQSLYVTKNHKEYIEYSQYFV